MSKVNLPKQVDPIRFAENAADLHGKLLVKNMPRLVDSLRAPLGDVAVDIQFGVDRQGIRHIKGQVQTTLTLECQRCLQAFPYEIASDFSYGLVSSEDEAKLLPSSYEPVLVQDGILNIQDMIEEELIVNLPIVSMHDPDDCPVKLPLQVASDEVAAPKVAKESPFKVIESLKVKPKQE